MKIPSDPDTLDWDKIKQETINRLVAKGTFKSIKEAEKLDWAGMISRERKKREKEYIEYTRHQELLTAIGACVNATPFWK
jgi:hypothetical protein